MSQLTMLKCISESLCKLSIGDREVVKFNTCADINGEEKEVMVLRSVVADTLDIVKERVFTTDGVELDEGTYTLISCSTCCDEVAQ